MIRKAIVLIDGKFHQLPSGDTLEGVVGIDKTITTYLDELILGSLAEHIVGLNREFQIIDTGFFRTHTINGTLVVEENAEYIIGQGMEVELI